MPSSPLLSLSGHSSTFGKPAPVAGMSPVRVGTAMLWMPSEITPMRIFLPVTRRKSWTRSARSTATPSERTEPAWTWAPMIGEILATTA